MLEEQIQKTEDVNRKPEEGSDVSHEEVEKISAIAADTGAKTSVALKGAEKPEASGSLGKRIPLSNYGELNKKVPINWLSL